MRRRERQRLLTRIIEAVVAVVFLFAICIWSARTVRRQKASEAHIKEGENVEKAETPFKDDTVEFEGKTYKRNTYMKAILCMGVDRTGSLEEKTVAGSGGQADGLFLIAQDTARGTLSLLMIPRDTMTEITLTDLSGNELGEGVQHLTLAYAYGDGREKSCEYMVKAVSKLLGGLTVDYYLAADVDVISVLNDMVGGVTVTVPTEGMEKADPSFVWGETVTLKGKQAEKFVRYRDLMMDHSALYRMDQQEEYIRCFYRQIKEKASEDNMLIPRLFEGIEANMVTNMKKDQYLKIAVDGVNAGEISAIYTVPGEGVTTAKYDEFYPDEEGVKKVILSLFYREED